MVPEMNTSESGRASQRLITIQGLRQINTLNLGKLLSDRTSLAAIRSDGS
jgi:hypothetical protein